MGYYSEVYIAVPKKAETEMDKAMNKHNLLKKMIKTEEDLENKFCDTPFKKFDHEQTYTQHENDKWIKKTKKLVIYEGVWLKWYSEFKDVQAVTSVVENHEDDGACIVCVGEDGAIHSDTGEYQDVFNVYVKVELT